MEAFSVVRARHHFVAMSSLQSVENAAAPQGHMNTHVHEHGNCSLRAVRLEVRITPISEYGL